MNAETSLFVAAQRCLLAADPADKIALTRDAAAAHADGRLHRGEAGVFEPIDSPGRPPRPLLVDPRRLPQRGLGSVAGRAALLHAVAHIEFNAINLAWDAVHRFRDMPDAYYTDWIGVAADEARHFGMVCDRLVELGHRYGDFDAHDGLWDMALRTSHDCLERMALVPRVLEARGLDVTPAMIARLRGVGDDASAALLETILDEEVAHVAAGSHWFRWCCARAGVDAAATFDGLLSRHMGGALRGPFNIDARLAAGFSREELDRLVVRAA